MLRQATQNLITALYPRLSHEDELQGESNSISKPKKDTRNLCKTERLYQSALVHRRRLFRRELPKTRFSSHAWDIEAGKVGTVIVKDMTG